MAVTAAAGFGYHAAMKISARRAAAQRALQGAALGALLLIPLAQAQEDGPGRLAACASCHGEHGEGVPGSEYQPHLAGKPAGYLFAQLANFRDGRRLNAQMTWLLRFMDDAYLHEIADHYAAQPPRTRPADRGAERLTPAFAATAKRLVREGDPAREVPACSACHGERLTGLEPGVPALVGLPADYVFAQLGNWRSGVRRATAPDCMAEVAKSLSDDELRAVAVWLSQQAHADAELPAPAGSFEPPRRCGSLETAGVAP